MARGSAAVHCAAGPSCVERLWCECHGCALRLGVVWWCVMRGVSWAWHGCMLSVSSYTPHVYEIGGARNGPRAGSAPEPRP